MSQTIDTNILVYASHTNSPHYDRARALVEHLVAGPAITYLLWPTIVGYLRIVTHPSIIESPLSCDEAMSNIDNVMAPAHIRIVGEGDDFWARFRGVTDENSPKGNLVPDAHLVALMHGHGVSTIWTRDRGFRVFSGITVNDPFDTRYSAGFG